MSITKMVVLMSSITVLGVTAGATLAMGMALVAEVYRRFKP